MGRKDGAKVGKKAPVGRCDHRKGGRLIRSEDDIAAENGGDANEEDDENDDSMMSPAHLSINVSMWEFGQNDPKRDSGSKLCRLGYASKLRIGQTFPGVVLSSEASIVVNPSDADIVKQYGVAGINCSWNRLDEVPFGSMGKGRNQRLLPLLFAANSVNYGRPFKMNTAEALAACLYITGFKDEARILLSPFSYGPEFLRLNYDALEAYSACKSSEEVNAVQEDYVRRSQVHQKEKEENKQARDRVTADAGRMGGYMDDMDLPPSYSDDEEYEGGYEDEEEQQLPDEIEGKKAAIGVRNEIVYEKGRRGIYNDGDGDLVDGDDDEEFVDPLAADILNDVLKNKSTLSDRVASTLQQRNNAYPDDITNDSPLPKAPHR